MDVLVLEVAREDLDPFNEGLLEAAELDILEPREGGSAGSGKFNTRGDCSLDEGTETIMGDDTAVAAGLCAM